MLDITRRRTRADPRVVEGDVFMARALNLTCAVVKQGSVELGVRRLGVHVEPGVKIVATCVNVNMVGGVIRSQETVSVGLDI